MQRTYLRGVLVAREGRSLVGRRPSATPNRFKARVRSPEDFICRIKPGKLAVIEAMKIAAAPSATIFTPSWRGDHTLTLVISPARTATAPKQKVSSVITTSRT
ncbi:MAG: hypothetical protein HC844_07440 [Tabrizicola sp.]|nr:hypothetical protein [Tabrizicola sp.]